MLQKTFRADLVHACLPTPACCFEYLLDVRSAGLTTPSHTAEGIAGMQGGLTASCCAHAQVTDAGLATIAHHWRLVSLDLSGCVQLTPEGLQHLKGAYLLEGTVMEMRSCPGAGPALPGTLTNVLPIIIAVRDSHRGADCCRSQSCTSCRVRCSVRGSYGGSWLGRGEQRHLFWRAQASRTCGS